MWLAEPLRRLFAGTVLLEHPDDFTIVSVDPEESELAHKFLVGLSAFFSVTFDEREVSVVLRSVEWERLKGNFTRAREAGPYRLITFDIVLDLSVVGFLAAVSALLAEQWVSIYPLSTFLRDHILIRREDAGSATEALQRLIDECKRSLVES